MVDKVRGSPQCLVPGKTDEILPTASIGVHAATDDQQGDKDEVKITDAMPVGAAETAPEKAPHRMHVLASDILKYGKTMGCPACDRGPTGSRPHSDACRDRIRSKMQDDEDGRARLERESLRQEKQFEKELEKQILENPRLAQEQIDHEMELDKADDKRKRKDTGDGNAPAQGPRRERAPGHAPAPPAASGSGAASSSSKPKRRADEPLEELAREGDDRPSDERPAPGPRDELTNPSRKLTENETTDHLMKSQFRDPMMVTQ